ncbi:MAG: EAL domain-containing protein [Gammaproteobacteria bacterium]|nr:EAL domain-containing protein [Gammaproteobacteria bacterium]
MRYPANLRRLMIRLAPTLLFKMLLSALLLGALVYSLLGGIQQHVSQDWFNSQFQARDQALAVDANSRFHRSLQAFASLAELLAAQPQLQARLGMALDGAGVLQSWRPAWLTQTVLSESFPPLGVALLLDPAGRVLEGYRQDGTVADKALLDWSRGGFQWHPRQQGVALLDHQPLAYASHPVSDAGGRLLGILVLASPINTEYFSATRIADASKLQLALLVMPEGKVVASSAPGLLHPGRARMEGLDALGRYPLDVGSGTDGLQLAVYRPTESKTALLASLQATDRQQRLLTLILSLLLVAAFTLWVSRRIQRLNNRVDDFAQRMGMTPPRVRAGDELRNLERRFQRFSEEVLAETTALEYQALHDTLTGLPNRMLLQDRLEHAIAQSLREQNNMAFLLMDLDRFKEINDTLGHHIGDRLLQETARRIGDLLRKSDTFARLGGDEFAVLLPATQAKHAKTVCRKIVEAVEKPFTIDKLCLRVGVSIGVAMCPESGEDATTLLQRADVAMYNAKRGGLGFTFYKPEQDEHSISRLGLVGELKDAVEKNQLELCYQPMVDMRNGRITSAEALVRWNHPTLGQIAPDEFIPLAEQSGVIRDLTMWVFHNALTQWSRWHQDGIELHLSLNMSVRVLQDKELPVKVQRLIEHHGINPEWLTLEVTESAIMSDPVTARRVMRRLADMGLKLSIDDFGTGYSSLAYLKQLPVDTVKIDKSFVTHMDQNENDAVIVRATIDLAHNLGLKVVAEGVESEDVWDLLEMLGCDIGQGFLIRRPIGAGELARWIASQRWKSERWALHRLAQVPA